MVGCLGIDDGDEFDGEEFDGDEFDGDEFNSGIGLIGTDER